MPTRHCCPECFGDRELRQNIFPSLGATRGTCSFCKSDNVALVEPKALGPVFGLLVSTYEANSDGKTLVEWMKEDWKLFSHPSMDIPNAKDLLAEILDDGEIVRRTFSRASTYESETLAGWETLRRELMFENRYFPHQTLDKTRLTNLLSHLIAHTPPTHWYRARIRSGNTQFSPVEMGAPPVGLASYGRANPAGIPYLYLASNPETAVAEIRPHTGDTACVADFTILNDLKIVDLRDPREIVSPFILYDEAEIAQLREDIPFLERLGEELTRPVLPQKAAIDYIPSQYLCELIKNSGFDGVMYRSSVSDGINLALFDPHKAAVGDVEIYNINRVSVDVAKSLAA